MGARGFGRRACGRARSRSATASRLFTVEHTPDGLDADELEAWFMHDDASYALRNAGWECVRTRSGAAPPTDAPDELPDMSVLDIRLGERAGAFRHLAGRDRTVAASPLRPRMMIEGGHAAEPRQTVLPTARFLQAAVGEGPGVTDPAAAPLRVSTGYLLYVLIGALRVGFVHGEAGIPELPPESDNGAHELVVLFSRPAVCPSGVSTTMYLGPKPTDKTSTTSRSRRRMPRARCTRT